MTFLQYVRANAPEQEIATLDQAFAILRDAWRAAQQRSAPSFCTGDRVEFSARGQIVRGVVERINKATVAVKADDTGAQWRISPGLLRNSTTKGTNMAVLT